MAKLLAYVDLIRGLFEPSSILVSTLKLTLRPTGLLPLVTGRQSSDALLLPTENAGRFADLEVVIFSPGDDPGIDVPELINELITRVSDNKWVILFIINIILLIVGTFMDITPAILIFTPIFLPIAQHLGIDPIHFGIIMVFNLTIGLCTPPVGTILFVGCSIGKVSIDRAIKPLLPMFLALFVVMAIICYFPQLSLMLPGLFST